MRTTLAFARRLVAVLNPIVQPGSRFDERVLHAWQFQNLSYVPRSLATSSSLQNARTDNELPSLTVRSTFDHKYHDVTYN